MFRNLQGVRYFRDPSGNTKAVRAMAKFSGGFSVVVKVFDPGVRVNDFASVKFWRGEPERVIAHWSTTEEFTPLDSTKDAVDHTWNQFSRLFRDKR